MNKPKKDYYLSKMDETNMPDDVTPVYHIQNDHFRELISWVGLWNTGDKNEQND